MKALKNILLIGVMSCAPFVVVADDQVEEGSFEDMIAVIDFLKTEMNNHGEDFSQMKLATAEMMNHFDDMDEKRHEAFECIRSEFENLNNLLAICEQQKAEQAEQMNVKQVEIDNLSNDLGLRDAQIDQLNDDYQALMQEHNQCVQDHDAFVSDTTQKAGEMAQRLVDLSNAFNAMNIERTDFVSSNQSMHDRINQFVSDHDQEGHDFVDEICGENDHSSETE